jgi:wobble nucleotide-excising tRNase
MIHKIERVTSVGKFRNFNASGDIAFKKLTLIYSDNGSGKTTLTSIIRSLVENNVGIVQKRITTNSQLPQAIQIIQRNGANTDTFHTYRSTGWSNSFSNVEIFDIHFVNNNIYSGFNFDSGHGQNLHQFAIGVAGVQIREQIERNKADKTAIRTEIDRLRNAIINQVAFGLTDGELDAFINLTTNDAINIDSRIADSQANLTNAHANQVIQTLQNLSPLNAINVSFDFAEIIRDIQANVQQIQDEALRQLFQNHCQSLSTSGVTSSETWIRQGHNFVRNKKQQGGEITCPFCSQGIADNHDLLKAYAQIFNDTFNASVRRIESHRTALQSFNLEAALQGINLTHNQNPNRIASWVPYISGGSNTPDFSFMPEVTILRNLLDGIIQLLSTKLSDPSISVNSDSVLGFQQAIQSLNVGINNYNRAVQEFNSQISRFKASIVTISQAQSTFDRLNRIKQRFQPAIVTMCAQLITARGRRQTLETEYPTLVAQQETDSNTFFSQYSTSVNIYLRDVFRTPYQIINVQNIKPQGKATLSRFGYTLTIDGHPISFDLSQANSVKDCLSEGDKSTLALAFLLAKLENDPNKANKIVILDDPLSSFDKNRRLQTIRELLRLYTEVKQLIVLSHDGKFLHDLNRRVRRGEKKGLRISVDVPNNTSYLHHFDIEKSLQNDYFTCLDRIRDFLSNGTDTGKREMRREIRIALEHYLIFKYYNSLGTIEGTFGNLIERLRQLSLAGQIQFRDTNSQAVLNDLDELNEISWDSHHGDGDVFETFTETPIEQITLADFKSYLQKTLDLINNRI